MSKTQRYIWATALSLLLWPFGSSLLWANSKAKIILTAKDYAITSDESFSALGRINGTVVLPAPIGGRHTLDAIWIGPNGVENQSKSILDFSSQPQQTLSVWLDFGSNGGLLSSVRDRDRVDSSYGGNWVVRILLDGKEIAAKNFLVD